MARKMTRDELTEHFKYLDAYRDGREAQQRLRAYFETYNSRRLHQMF
jgi:hypothetical protein